MGATKKELFNIKNKEIEEYGKKVCSVCKIKCLGTDNNLDSCMRTNKIEIDEIFNN